MSQRKKENITLFIILTILACIVLSGFLSMHYATDTYNIINVGYETYATNWSLKDGRILMYLITMLAQHCHTDIRIFVIGLLTGAILVSNISVIVFTNILGKYKQFYSKFGKIMAVVIASCTIYNFMYIENLYFVESFVMAISILAYLIAADILTEKKPYAVIKSLLLVLLGVFSYQGTIGIFIAWVILFSILKNKNQFMKLIQDILEAGFIIIIAVIANIGIVKMVCNIYNMQQIRMGSIEHVFQNIVIILKNLGDILIRNVGLFPQYVQLAFLIIICSIIVVYLLHTKQNAKKLGVCLAIIIVATVVSGTITYFMSLTSFYTGRLRFALGALIGIIFSFLFVSTDIFEQKHFQILMIMVLFSYIMMTVYQYVTIIQESKLVNQMEKEQVVEIERYIQQYEKENNITVTDIAIRIVQGEEEKCYAEQTKKRNVLTYNALKCDWSVDGVINYYTGRKLKKVNHDTEILEKEGQEYLCYNQCFYIKVYMY